ncbi:hypothetical protein CHUAL_003373 [Chamberlinius hualienensis]
MFAGDLFVGHSIPESTHTTQRQLLLPPKTCCHSKGGVNLGVEYSFNIQNITTNFDIRFDEHIERSFKPEIKVHACLKQSVHINREKCDHLDDVNRQRVATFTATMSISNQRIATVEGGWNNVKDISSETDDFSCIRDCVMRLEDSGFYYGKLSWSQATKLLKSTEIGTFLVRDSSDPAYLFALSVQTEYGPTSIRIHYANGLFMLDAEKFSEQEQGRIPRFDCVVKLVDYYINYSSDDKGLCRYVWLDGTGRRGRITIMKKPLFNHVRSLKHLCRVVHNKNPQLSMQLKENYPKHLQRFVEDYSFTF